MRFCRAKIGLICALIALMLRTSCVFADSYGKYTPAETPITFFKDYTSLTIDISPKYSVIKWGVPLTWDVNIRMDILDDCRVSKITFYIEFINTPEEPGIPNIPEDFKDGNVEVKDSLGNVVGKMEFWKTEVYAESVETYIYRGVVTADQYFMKGEYFSRHFSYYDGAERRRYLFFLKGTEDGFIPYLARENGFYTRFGPSNSSDIPRFPIPELPLGPWSAIVAALLALKFRKSRA
jgi:hypothetical protein